MLILHASARDGQLLFWGETPPDDSASNDPQLKKESFQFAFDPGAATLAATLSESLAGKLTARNTEWAVLWLPTVKDTPIASSSLVADPPSGRGKPTLTPWAVTVLPLDTSQSLEVLCACVGRDLLRPGVVVGSTLAYWTRILQYAGALVTREQFVPGAEIRGNEWRACWQPVLAGPEADHLAQLAQLMPAACRALNSDAERQPEIPARAVLLSVLSAQVDTLVRSALPAVSTRRPARGKGTKPAFASVHDQWLHALRARDSVMAGTETEQRELLEQLRAWQRPLVISVSSPFRLCFRLEEPAVKKNGDLATPKGPWTVRYLLQGRSDPSLLIPVKDAWAPKGSVARVFKEQNFQPREYLLTTLGQASAICPPVEASLKAASPASYTADVHGAHRFLSEFSLLLEQAGFGVLLPAWWSRKGTKQHLTAQAHVHAPGMPSLTGISLNSVLTFDWQVALGDEVLTLEELQALAKLKAPLVRIRGQWVELSAEEIQAALDFWKQKEEGQAKARDIVRMALGMGQAPGGLEVSGVSATGWIADLLEQLQGQANFEELAPPAGFSGTLRPYQVRGYSWLAFLGRWGLGACLADDMGLGKTIQTLVLIQKAREDGETRPTLLLCPTSVVGNWKKEAERFTPTLPVLVHHGSDRARGATFAREANKHALVLSSYSLLYRDLALFQKVPWASVVLDEAQNIKNPDTKQARAARALEADQRIALTGTPVENHVGDLWSIMEFLQPGHLGSQLEFRNRFYFPIQAERSQAASRRLHRLTGPFILRRLKTDKSIIADLPDKLEMKVYATLTREQATLYAATVEAASDDLYSAEGIQRKGQILGLLSRLKQVCNHPAQFLGDNSAIPDRSGKLTRLTEMLEEILEVGERALIFTQFTEMGDIIRRHLRDTFGQEVLFLHGGVPAKKRNDMVARFQDKDGPPLFLLSLKAGGTGLNLTAANHVFHFDRWWNPAVEDQATDRAFRIGQTREVQVHKFVCVGTLEEKIDDMIERKKQVAQSVVGSGEGWLTELSNEELKDLFRLRKYAVGE
jgi:hypothetical protein